MMDPGNYDDVPKEEPANSDGAPESSEELQENNSAATHFNDACAATFAIDPYLAHAARDLYDAAVIAVQQLLASVPEDSQHMQQLLSALGDSFGPNDPCLTDENVRIDAILGMLRTSGSDTRIDYARHMPPHSMIQSITQAASSHMFDRERAKAVGNPWTLWLKHPVEKPVLLVRADSKQQTAILDLVQERQSSDWAPNSAVIPPSLVTRLLQSPASFYSHLQAGTHLGINTAFIPMDNANGPWEYLINRVLETHYKYGLYSCILVPPSAFSIIAPMIAANEQLQVATLTPAAFVEV